MNLPTLVCAAAAICGALASGSNAAPVEASPAAVCVTNGDVTLAGDGRFLVESGSSRAVVNNADDRYVGLLFEYLGPSLDETRLKSGGVARQLGLKLQAQDSCNVVYVMWPLEAEELVVLTKVNQGMSRHAQCGVKGYRKLTPSFSKRVTPITAGEPRRLEAGVASGQLAVKVDGEPVWQGPLDGRALGLLGHPGLRTDNVRVRFRWLVEAEPPVRPEGRPPAEQGCRVVKTGP